MLDKKGDMSINKVVAAALGLLILGVVAYGLIGNIFGGQIAFAGEQTERVTEDCDNDNAIGLSDQCPCVKDVQKKNDGEKCGDPDDVAVGKCPKLCKK